MASLKKKLKKLGKKAKKAVKSIGKAAGTVLRVAAPVAAALIPGAQGIAVAAGSAVVGSALKGGNRKKKLKALTRTGTHVGVAVAGKAALGLVSGSGIGSSVITSGAKIVGDVFGGGGGPAEAPIENGSSGLDDALLQDAQTHGYSGDMSKSLQAAVRLGESVFSGAGPGGVGAGRPGQTVNPDEAGERGGGPFGDQAGFDASGSGEGGGISPLVIALGLGAVLLLARRKK